MFEQLKGVFELNYSSVSINVAGRAPHCTPNSSTPHRHLTNRGKPPHPQPPPTSYVSSAQKRKWPGKPCKASRKASITLKKPGDENELGGLASGGGFE